MNRRQGLLGLSLGGSLILAAVIIGPLIGLVGQTLLGQAPAALWHQLLQPQNQTSLQHSLFLGVGTMILTTLIATPLALIMTRTPLAHHSHNIVGYKACY